MTDLLRLARQRRAVLIRELAGIDRFVRTAEALIVQHAERGNARRRLSEQDAPLVDPFQARFNSGEVLPPLPPDARDRTRDDWVPVDVHGVHFVRKSSSEG